ncbi:hypothetical protein RRG08_045168 [Elysia crispata]|uniref:Uncharacterized protein n=1 Tax=Elysia crispata TaxID=231223 RepID=A0AAE1DWD1_9GAST|nr:hypothetical protein RRG08_045168 [Elysia crispata]
MQPILQSSQGKNTIASTSSSSSWDIQQGVLMIILKVARGHQRSESSSKVILLRLKKRNTKKIGSSITERREWF